MEDTSTDQNVESGNVSQDDDDSIAAAFRAAEAAVSADIPSIEISGTDTVEAATDSGTVAATTAENSAGESHSESDDRGESGIQGIAKAKSNIEVASSDVAEASGTDTILSSAPEEVPHTSNWGRAANDPRINPGMPVTETVLREAPAIPAVPALEPASRDLDATHPSRWGRAANDPRSDLGMNAASD